MTNSRCPEPQVLQAFVEGRLDPAERQAVLAHLDVCESCMRVIDMAAELYREEAPGYPVAGLPGYPDPPNRPESSWSMVDGLTSNRQPATINQHDGSAINHQPSTINHPGNRGRWWLAMAAAIALVVAGVATWLAVRARSGGPSMRALVAAAPRGARVVEARLSGGFAWAAYLGPSRSDDPATDEERLKLAGLAGDALEAARTTPTAATQHTAGVALLLAGRGDASIALLEEATRRAPDDPRAWNDLAAARYAAAVMSGQAARYPVALAAADRALRLDPTFAEALFNRALILEQLGLAAEARQAWQRYLQADPGSRWAGEAREHLAKLPPAAGVSRFEHERPRLERAALANDRATVLAIVAAHPERSRAFGEAEYLGRWAEALAGHDEAEAAKNLAVSRAIGDALASTSGEALLGDAVRAIDSAEPSRRAALAAAHATYRRGRMTYARGLPAAAEPDLRAAAAQFDGTPMARVARYFAANTRFDQGDVAVARAELEGLLGELAAHPGYAALGAQVRWELALCHTAADDWSGALPLLTESAALFRRLGERSNLGFVETLLAATLASTGRPDEAAAARIRSFALASSDPHGDRLAISIVTAATAELRTGRRDAARALLELAQSAAQAADNDALRVDVLMQSALLEADDGDAAAAIRNAAAATASAQRLADPPLRARALALARLASAAAQLPAQPAAARRLAGQALDFFLGKGFSVHLPFAHLLRARAAMQTAARDDAARDLELGIAALEQHRIALAHDLGATGVLDAADALFDDAIALALDRGDTAAAFRYAEREHARSSASREPLRAVTIAELQQRLRGTDTMVLSLSVLPGRIVSFAVTADDVAAGQREIGAASLDELLMRAATLTDDGALRELYDLLIRPVEPSLAGSRRLVVVAGAVLDAVPFGALLGGASRPLVARLPVAMATSAGSLSRSRRPAVQRLLGIALPSGEATNLAALPETAEEVAAIAGLYRDGANVLPPAASFATFAAEARRADVVHVAGHTERQRGNDDSALVFAGGETVSWRTVAEAPIGTEAVAVLSACETLRRPRSPQRRALSIGAGFLGAGAAEAIGTLAPVRDRSAATLFREVHRQLAAGADAATAVREAQLLAIARGDVPPADWRALAALTKRID